MGSSVPDLTAQPSRHGPHRAGEAAQEGASRGGGAHQEGISRVPTLRAGVEAFQRRWPGVRSPSHQSPIFLMAAGWRTGSTLLQRMLSGDCLIWGEPFGQGGLLDSVPDLFRRITGFWPEESFFFRGQGRVERTCGPIENLYPSPEDLVRAYVGFFERLFAQPAAEAGFARWGMKTVRLSADHAFFFRWLFPPAKLVFLTRNPYHAFRSYWTISQRRGVRWFHRWPDRPVTPEHFARHWAELTAGFLEHAEELGAHFVRYEDLIGGAVALGELEEYLGVQLSRDALASNPGGWPIPDEELAAPYYEAIAQWVEPLAERLGYAKPTAGSPQGFRQEVPKEASADQTERAFQEALGAHQRGDLETAERTYRRILDHEPNHAGAWHFLGVISLVRRDYPAARQQLERSLTLCDSKAVYWNNYGALLKEVGEYRQAEAAFHRALQRNQDYADAWANLGHVQYLLHLAPQLVERSLRSALALNPHHADATFWLGDFYQACGRAAEAVAQYRRGLELAPEYPGGHKRLAEALAAANQFEAAKDAFQEAIARRPEDVQLHLALGAVHAKLEEVEAAKETYRRAALLCPERAIWRWKYLGVCPTVFDCEEEIEQYWQGLREGLLEALEEKVSLDWRVLPFDGYTPSFNLPHLGRCCREIKELFSARFEPAFPQRALQPGGGRKIRVGFLVTAGHEGGFLRGMSKIVAGLDHRFEVAIFCAEGAVGRFRAAIARDDVRYVSFPRRFDQAVEAVRETRCHIIYHWKVGPDPWSYFLPMARLAPVQCVFRGSHGTSGVRAVDYYISSPWMECPEEAVDSAQHYTERLILLETFPMFQSQQPMPQDVGRGHFGLPGEGAFYFCPHRLPKYCPQFDFFLREILEADPRGFVVLLAGPDGRLAEKLRRRMEGNLGVVFRRVYFRSAMPVAEYYRLLRLATVVLDTPVYASCLTAYDAFSMGVPVLTQPGPLAVQCYAAGLYRRMGMEDELVVWDGDEYVAKAVRIGTEPEYREHLVRWIGQRAEAVFDDQRVIGQYERFFESAMERTPAAGAAMAAAT